MQEDSDLIDLYKKQQDMKALGQLYQRYSHLVYGVCLKYLRDRDEAKDAVMGIFEKLIQDLLKHDVDNFKSWLHVLSRNFCLMQLRKQKGTAQIEISEFSNDQSMEFAIAVHHDDDDDEIEKDIELLIPCIETLQLEQQKCIKLFYLDQNPYKVVAETTGYDMNKVKSYIQNGKRNVKKCIENRREKF